ncbi:PAS domain-containing protein [Leisingera methylohalidivorans]|uniref:histidine kinase n=1 Tax=Leisingera methylohalidivorans DSM 14336 TaxID=999552 RepID=V9VPN7_9RHOB|nr:PAS domain-containing protein [Leisingera methylohalidivorans]AHC99982.1 histidine kinase [Leisingera methylohalidivorans DSM 14336]
MLLTEWSLSSGREIADIIIRNARLPLCITDPNLPDNPIIFANPAFCELTGYPLDEVTGRNCRFLQGPDTTPESVAAVRELLSGQTVGTVEILNYRKDGSAFLNALQTGSVLGADGKAEYIFGSQLGISAKRAAERRALVLADRELQNRLGNIVNVMSVVIRMTAQEECNSSELGKTLTGRLEALGKAHIDSIVQPARGRPGLHALAEQLLTVYAPLGSRQVSLSGADFTLPEHLVSPLTLVLHELAANAVKHGGVSCAGGKVRLSWSAEGADLLLTWQETGGPAVTVPKRRHGSAIIRKLMAASGGRLEFDWQPSGLVATAAFTA